MIIEVVSNEVPCCLPITNESSTGRELRMNGHLIRSTLDYFFINI